MLKSTGVFVFVAMSAACFTSVSTENTLSRPSVTPTPPDSKNLKPLKASAEGCDKSLWDHVYNPDRLEVLDECKTVTGTIEEQDANEDGDEHMLLKLDPGHDDLLLKRNFKKKQGDLVVEIVCANDVQVKKAKDACKGFTNAVHIPKIGDHVTVTGSYVNDSHNGWSEIHPASKIE